MVLPSNLYENELLNTIETDMKTNTEKDQMENANETLGGQNDNTNKTETKIAYKNSQTHQTKQGTKQTGSPVSKRTRSYKLPLTKRQKTSSPKHILIKQASSSIEQQRLHQTKSKVLRRRRKSTIKNPMILQYYQCR